jgi:hypothetical protein
MHQIDVIIKEIPKNLDENVEKNIKKLKNKDFSKKYKLKYNKKYKLENKKEISKKVNKLYKLKNKKQILKKQKFYYIKNKEIILEKQKQYKLKNKDKIKQSNLQYRLKNKNIISKKRLERRRNNPIERLTHSLRSRLRSALKGKNKANHTMELIGCSPAELWDYLEKKFKSRMTRQNYGKNGWEIDHIIPCASFDLSDHEQQRKCFHYTNLQPLWALENMIKGAKV